MPNNHEGVVDAREFVEQLDTSGEVAYAGKVVRVTTANSIYEYDDVNRKIAKVFNNGKDLGYTQVMKPKKARVEGTTFGGSMIKPDVLIPGAFMEFVVWDAMQTANRLTSSEIKSIEVIG